jgi:predicted PurR-regulated permease PerM
MTDHDGEARSYRIVRQVGVTAWTIIGLLVLLVVGISLLAGLSELMLPLAFAVMLGAAMYPLARRLQQWMKPAPAAAVVLGGSLVAVGAVIVFTVRNVVQQTGEIAAQIDHSLDEIATNTDSVGLDAAALEALRKAVAAAGALIAKGLLTLVVGGVGAIAGFVAGTVLAILIGYYMLKDGPLIKDWLVRQFPDSLQAEVDDYLHTGVLAIRSYWAGRSVLSACVTVVIVVASVMMGLPLIGTIAVVNFLGGYVPYLGAFIGGGLATLLAYADGGLRQALVMLFVVLVTNLLLENLLEPKIMSDRLSIHPLVVLLATTVGGIVGGMVGLILAVLVIDLVRRLRVSGLAEAIPEKVKSLTENAVGTEDAVGTKNAVGD